MGLALLLLVASCRGGSTDPSKPPSPADTGAPLIISTDNAAGIKSEDFNPVGAPFDDFLVIMQAMNEPAFDVTLIAASRCPPCRLWPH